jgi:hypothetical protein
MSVPETLRARRVAGVVPTGIKPAWLLLLHAGVCGSAHPGGNLLWRECPRSGVTLVRDRVCNTFLARKRALVAMIDDRDE